MDKKRAVELLIQEVDKIPYLKTLPPNNDDFRLWLKNVENIINTGLEPDDKNKYFEASQFLRYIRREDEEDLIKQDYVDEIIRYEIALKLIIQKYEILGIVGEPAVKIEPKGTVKSPLQLFDALQFHPKVIEASRELFKDGHYRDAIYRAFVEVNNFVKRRAKSQLDGRKLMSTVFSPDNPIIKLNTLETQTDKDEQEGFMYLFMGAMQGIRNPKAHENIIQNNPYIALKLIGYASLLIETIAFWEAGDN